MKVAEGLFDVHTRVLWDVGWLNKDASVLGIGGDYYTFNEDPKYLVVDTAGRTLILSPLNGYGTPPIPAGATRRVRLYVNYGHQWQCRGSAVTIRVTNGTHSIDFDLPLIHGWAGAPAANWSSFADYESFKDIGHARMQIFLKDYMWGGGDCGPYPSGNDAKGVVFRIEAHYYDDYGE